MKWIIGLLVAFSVDARPAPPQVIYVTNYIFGVVTNYVNTTNTINNFTFVSTTNTVNLSVTNQNYLASSLTNLTVHGTLTVLGTNGSVTTYNGTNVTGHLP